MTVRYRGHRRDSFTAIDISELVEIRARQRTFHGAYIRGGLSALGFSLFIIRIFDSRFYRIGLLYAILGCLFFIVSYIRTRSMQDFSDCYSDSSCQIICTKGTENTRNFGKPFRTPGRAVVLVTAIVAATEIVLLVLVLRI